MVIGNVVYQFILDCFFINHNLIIVMLKSNICTQQVESGDRLILIYVYMYAHTYVRIHNTGISITAEKLTALSSVHQFDYCQMNNTSHQYCVVHDGASDGRAKKCSVKGHLNHRRRYLSLHTTTTGKQVLEIYVLD